MKPIPMKEVGNKNNNKGEKIMSKMELLFRIKDKDECSNMGGIAIDSNGTLYCVKSKQGDSLQCLYVINNYRSAEIKKEVVTPSYTYMYGWLGHANSLTLSDGFLYVGTDKNYIIKLNASKLSTGRYDAGEKILLKKKVKQNDGKYKLTEVTDISISSIANINGSKFVLHFSKQGESKTNRIYFNKEVKSYTEKTPKGDQDRKYIEYSSVGKFEYKYPDDLKSSIGEHAPQDVYYKNGYLYFILAGKDEESDEFKTSYILKYKLGNSNCLGYDSFTSTDKNTIKFEIESMHIVGKKLVFSVNESKKTIINGKEKIVENWDAIYITRDWVLAYQND